MLLTYIYIMFTDGSATANPSGAHEAFPFLVGFPPFISSYLSCRTNIFQRKTNMD